MRVRICYPVLVFFLCGFFVLPGFSQQASETFGRNRVQYRQFEWKYVSSDNFDVYYYDERRRVATEATQYLETEFDRITDLIGYPPYLKTKVFLYNSVTDLQQSNMGIMGKQFHVGGETEFIKPYVEIAHPGSLDGFKEELILKVTDLMINEMMFGGSLKDMFQNAVLLNLPDWFVDGVSLYAARGWNAEMDDYARQLVQTKKVNKALKLTGPEAALIGQSIWNYIVEKHGKASVANILNYTRVIRNEQKSIYITLGVSFKQFISDWKKFYAEEQTRVSKSYMTPADTARFTSRHRKSIVYTTMKVSPDGKNLAYAENDRGKYSIIVKSLETGRETTILSGGNKVFRQSVDNSLPLLGWADAHTLGVIGVRYGQHIFWLYDLTTRSKIPRVLDRFSNIRSFNFSENGRLAVMSADMDGQNDLFLISTRRDRTQRLTNDLFDDFDPSFIPRTNTLVFSSNRTTDSTNTVKRDFTRNSNGYNLFSYNLDTTKSVVARITNTLSRDYAPKANDQNNIYYLSDQRGIVNLFRYSLETGVYNQVTNFESSIKSFDIDFGSRLLSVVMTNSLREDIFVYRNFNLDRQIFTPATKRKEMQQVRNLTERRKKEVKPGISLKQLINERLQQKQDTTEISQSPDSVRTAAVSLRVVPADSVKRPPLKPGEINVDDYRFEDEALRKDTVVAPVPEKKVADLNTDDYRFEDEALKTQPASETFLSRYMKARESSRINGPFPYQPKFSYESFVTNFVIDPLRGFSLRLETQMNDILENFRIHGGIQTAFDWKSGDVFGEIHYLKHRIDYSVRYDRKVIFWTQEDRQQKYSWQKIEFGAALPLTVRTRVALKPFVGYTHYVDRGPDQRTSSPPAFQQSKEQFYAGTRAEIVYDNSVSTGLNLIEGTRGKINFVHYEGIGNKRASFSQVSVDVRHYQKLYREIVIAVRGYTGTFFGNSPKQYALGGVDNWFGNRINYEGVKNPLYVKSGFNDNLIFTEFATTLRGFDYATLYGTSVAMFNAEFRLPLVRALAGGSVSSGFFRNMQLTAFYDIGTSWTGAPPINSENTLRTVEIKSGPFLIDLKQYLNPWLYSYGFGFRSMILGYYLKFDYAWPVENYKVQNPRLMVSVGFDF
ncbi:MAG: translocation protein TolB [Cytophagales bacterium]|nr:translocation protein TolB [Cytophagales bacterium]